MRPLQIVVVQETDWLDRGPHQQHHLFERLAARGHAVTALDFEILYRPFPAQPLLAPRLQWQSVRRTPIDSPGVTVIRPATVRLPLLARPLSLITFLIELIRLCRARKPDLIVSYALSTGLPALIVARLFGVPFLFHVIDALHTLVPFRVLQPVALAFERTLLRAADCTLYINEGLRRYGISLGARPDKAEMIRSGVDLQRFSPDDDTAHLRAAWGLAADDVVLLFIGWLYEHAGVDSLMRLLPALPGSVKLLVVGRGDVEDKLKALHRELKLGERVIFTGQQPYHAAPRLMAMADICTLYSTVNAITTHIVPIKTYEYMAAGKPVLASPLPGVMLDVPPDNGVVYAEQAALLSTIQQLLNPDLRRALGAKARAFVKAHCDWERLTDEFEGLLGRLSAKRQ